MPCSCSLPEVIRIPLSTIYQMTILTNSTSRLSVTKKMQSEQTLPTSAKPSQAQQAGSQEVQEGEPPKRRHSFTVIPSTQQHTTGHLCTLEAEAPSATVVTLSSPKERPSKGNHGAYMACIATISLLCCILATLGTALTKDLALLKVEISNTTLDQANPSETWSIGLWTWCLADGKDGDICSTLRPIGQSYYTITSSMGEELQIL